MRTTFLLAAIFSVSLVFTSCAPSADPLLQNRIQDYFLKASGESHPSTTSFAKPMPYAIGQWILLGSTDKDGKRTVAKTSIVGKDGAAWILESYSLTESSEGWVQLALTGMEQAAETMDPDKIDILWVKQKTNDNQVQRIEGPVLSLMKGTFKSSLSGAIIKAGSMEDGGEVVVPGGSFGRCVKTKTEVTFLLWSDEVDAWFHSEVPMSGMVKCVSKGGVKTELLAFGLSGAKPSF